MTRLLLLGATGRTGVAILRQLSEHKKIQVTAAVRNPSDASRLPKTKELFQTVTIDIDDISSLRNAASHADIVVNAIRLRGDVSPTAWIELDTRIRESVDDMEGRLIITVGGAGSLHLPNGGRICQDPSFPKRTLPRGIAQARLRDYLQETPPLDSWAYLIPPPAYIPMGLRTGNYNRWKPSNDESKFLGSSISYDDFSSAVWDAIEKRWTGVHLIGGQESYT
ncbi:NAD(P)-dependent oxidoreductase [Sporosarcina sp. FSL K6-3457]|uniref:NAD(P)-dependent oxidoreductase n=1 Tax=Sporosarcina sp. FSL K6-3457 TaxID=2978204 RepID=UPI0030F4F798